MRVRWIALFVLALAGLPAAAARGGFVYFVVSERTDVPVPGGLRGDSFVLPIPDTDAANIAHARDLIARGPDAAGDPIVLGRVAAGADGINRDVLATGQPAWSWHVEAFEGFAFVTAELFDWSPTQLEEDVAGYIANTGGQIGFWSYTVTAELPVPPSAVPLPPAVAVGGVVLAGVVAATRKRR